MTNESVERERRVLARIPGGAQLLSKRPEQFAPGQWPRHYSRAKGVYTWDLDGHRYVDMSTSGIGTCVLGFADDEVDSAVRDVIANGSMSTLNCIEELELAELLCELHPWADMVRYARSGGEALAIAVRLARAATGRSTVAFCGYHGWHDWYLAANLAGPSSLDGHLLPGLDPGGVPAQLAGTAFGFRYNRLDELEAIVAEHQLAAVVMEPMREHDPEPGFLPGVAELARRTGAVLDLRRGDLRPARQHRRHASASWVSSPMWRSSPRPSATAIRWRPCWGGRPCWNTRSAPSSAAPTGPSGSGRRRRSPPCASTGPTRWART